MATKCPRCKEKTIVVDDLIKVSTCSNCGYPKTDFSKEEQEARTLGEFR